MPSVFSERQPPRLCASRIAAARAHIDDCFLDAPQRAAPRLSAELGCHLHVVDDSANPIGCFKGRGAANLLAGIAEPCELVCASAGNFGLAMAYGCARRGHRLTVFAAIGANRRKLDGIREHGAAVVSIGDDFDEAKDAARAFAVQRGRRFVEDGAEVAISEGAGTLAQELLAGSAGIDTVLVPLGNGALLAGIACWMQAHAPEVRVIGVCSRAAPVMQQCWRRGGLPARLPSTPVRTIADGIAVRVPVASAVADLRHGVHDVLAVDDASLLPAMRAIHDALGIAVEPSAAVGLAAIRQAPQHFAGRRVALILTGRNLTAEQRHAWFS